ncbi:MAG: type II toxin-antitoxin system VapC family toxin [Nitrospinota bacterium]
MSRVILDTSSYSAFMKGNRDIKIALQQSGEINLNPVILGELLCGFKRGKYEQKNRKELEEFLTSPRVRLLEIDSETSERYAVILNSLWDSGTPIPTNDIWIAASAMQHGLKILTVDSHFNKISQVIVELITAL